MMGDISQLSELNCDAVFDVECCGVILKFQALIFDSLTSYWIAVG
jgi:hypothetical protein